MKSIKEYSFHDGKILSVYITDLCVEVLFEKWDCKQIKLYFEGYRIIKDNHSVGQDLGELLINSSEEIMDEVKEYIISDGGSEEEAVELNSYSFSNSFGDKMVFEIVAFNVRVEELH